MIMIIHDTKQSRASPSEFTHQFIYLLASLALLCGTISIAIVIHSLIRNKYLQWPVVF